MGFSYSLTLAPFVLLATFDLVAAHLGPRRLTPSPMRFLGLLRCISGLVGSCSPRCAFWACCGAFGTSSADAVPDALFGLVAVHLGPRRRTRIWDIVGREQAAPHARVELTLWFLRLLSDSRLSAFSLAPLCFLTRVCLTRASAF